MTDLGREVAKLMDKHGLGPAKPEFWLDLEALAQPQAVGTTDDARAKLAKMFEGWAFWGEISPYLKDDLLDDIEAVYKENFYGIS
jgi:hypothetical protein